MSRLVEHSFIHLIKKYGNNKYSSSFCYIYRYCSGTRGTKVNKSRGYIFALIEGSVELGGKRKGDKQVSKIILGGRM